MLIMSTQDTTYTIDSIETTACDRLRLGKHRNGGITISYFVSLTDKIKTDAGQKFQMDAYYFRLRENSKHSKNSPLSL